MLLLTYFELQPEKSTLIYSSFSSNHKETLK